MLYKKVGSSIVVRIDRGEEICENLLILAQKENIKAASITGIGAAGHVECGLYDIEKMEYKKHAYDGMFEITALCGNLSVKDGKPYLHLHITIADESGASFGGHLNSAVISATCEIFLTVLDGEIGRTTDSVTGLNIFELN